MLLKILLTAAVILVAVLVLRRRARQVAYLEHSKAESGVPPKLPGPRFSNVVAYSLLVVLLGGAALMTYLQWEDNHRVIGVRVINSETGKAVHYQAHRGDVEERSFRTLDGREVSLADVERMELGGKEPSASP